MNERLSRQIETNLSDILRNTRESDDMEVMGIRTDLLNTFIRAVKYRGKRDHFLIEDFASFARALEFLEKVRPESPNYRGNLAEVPAQNGHNG
jgi:hypothetical protein